MITQIKSENVHLDAGQTEAYCVNASQTGELSAECRSSRFIRTKI